MPAHWCIYKLMFYIHLIKYLFYISEYKAMLEMSIKQCRKAKYKAMSLSDTGTVSSLRLSISWTLTLTWNTQHYLHYLFITHTYFFISILHISDLYTHNCLYYIFSFCYFVHCLFVYLYIIILLSVSCPVAVFLLHCGASVTITNSLYV